MNLLVALSETGEVFAGTYAEYLCSPWWKHVRRLALNAAGNRCESCGAISELDVHHKTYDRLGREQPADVSVLCRHCHAEQHGRELPPHPARGTGFVTAGEALRRLLQEIT